MSLLVWVVVVVAFVATAVAAGALVGAALPNRTLTHKVAIIAVLAGLGVLFAAAALVAV